MLYLKNGGMRTLINKNEFGSVYKEAKQNMYYVAFNEESFQLPKEDYFAFVRQVWKAHSKTKQHYTADTMGRQIIAVPLRSQIVDLRLSRGELKALNDLLNPAFPYAKSYSSRKLNTFKIVAFYN